MDRKPSAVRQDKLIGVAPFMKWIDCWPRDSFDKPHMEAYKAFDSAGSIQIQKVVYSKAEQMVAVVFMTSFPVEWLHEEMGHLLKHIRADMEQQLSMV